ncbi:MAG: signal recognition particle-docking protein FtsY [Pseudomonadota bacterium]|nr:signal recognition particle-docking protein FtsY [Pseudomonadota bacterium]MDP1572665.1 signal recognition particle-docking protein FtsY [Pseudomonadota bacterium]MDP1906538.1 signal recognition particle-docking protein FtsY [Pseudomonadota bacterium]
MFGFLKSRKSPPDAASEAAPEAARAVEPELEPAPAPEVAPKPKLSWAQRLKSGLARTRGSFTSQVAGLFGVGAKIDEALFEELESVLLTADVGVEATQHLIEMLRRRIKRERLTDASQLKDALKAELSDLLRPLEHPLELVGGKPFVIMLAGVNGAGKTTTIGKLARRFQAEGKSVLLAAGDTFRAAAREQLAEWGRRNNVEVVSSQAGDAAAVIFDAIQSARARGIDVVLADTAGRLPTQLHLMEEIRKVKRVIQKADAGAPHEILLVLDANIGQNALAQVKAFDEALGLTGLVMTKLDGTAKGGVIAALAKKQPVPVRFIGVGEGLDDLQPFRVNEFVDALFA